MSKEACNPEIKQSESSKNQLKHCAVFAIGPVVDQTTPTEHSNVCFNNLLSNVDAKNSLELSAGSEFEETNTEPNSNDGINKTSTDGPSFEAHGTRAERLKNLELQAQWLVKKMNDTKRKGSALSSRLEELHETYGPVPPAPPMPDVLPAFRIKSELDHKTEDCGTDKKNI